MTENLVNCTRGNVAMSILFFGRLQREQRPVKGFVGLRAVLRLYRLDYESTDTSRM